MSKSASTSPVIHTGKRPDCPAWCVEEHTPEQIQRAGGIYHSAPPIETPVTTLTLCSFTDVDGSTAPDSAPKILTASDQDWTPDEARSAASDFAAAVFGLVEKAFGTTERPFWLTEPCPPWCVFTDSHRNGDARDDRNHLGEEHQIVLTLMSATRRDGDVRIEEEDIEPESATVWLRQHAEAKAPSIQIGKSESALELPFTIAEAKQLIGTLQKVIQEAEQSAATSAKDTSCK